jgi:hypothetical protein
MNIQIPDKLQGLLGLKCCIAKLALSNGLRIGFGNKVLSRHSKNMNRKIFSGEWELVSEFSSWRVLQDNRIVCSDCDGEEFSEPIVKSLLTGRLQDMIQKSRFDFSLVFDNGVTVDFFGISDTERAVEVWDPENIFFEFKAGQGWTEGISTSVEGLTKEEEILTNHSEKFHERWGEVVPRGELNNFCGECGFFLPLAGRFYFWDYGICSNEASINDGKLVGVKSGCTVFRESI